MANLMAKEFLSLKLDKILQTNFEFDQTDCG